MHSNTKVVELVIFWTKRRK